LIENHLSKRSPVDLDIGDPSSADSALPVQTSQKMDLADMDLEPEKQETPQIKEIKEIKEIKGVQKAPQIKEIKGAQKNKNTAYSKPNLSKLDLKKKDNKKINLGLAGKSSKGDPSRSVTKNKKPKGVNKKLILKEKGTTNKTNKKNKNLALVKTSVNRAKMNKPLNKSSNQSKTKEVQSTIDSYSKRVNKGKKK
jgi:hypothetical protein